MSYVLLATFAPALGGQLVSAHILPGSTDVAGITHFTSTSFHIHRSGTPTPEDIDLALGELTERYHAHMYRIESNRLCVLCEGQADFFGDCYDECWHENPLGQEHQRQEETT